MKHYHYSKLQGVNASVFVFFIGFFIAFGVA